MVLQFSFADGYRRLKNAVLRHQLTILGRRLQGRVRRKSFKHVAVKKAQSALAKLDDRYCWSNRRLGSYRRRPDVDQLGSKEGERDGHVHVTDAREPRATQFAQRW